MSETIDKAIAELQSQVRSLEEETSQVKATINLLCKRGGRDPMYADTSGPGADMNAIRDDTFYGQPLNSAVRQYLEMRNSANLGPATIREIYDALVGGGFVFNAKNDDNAMRSLRTSISKSSHTFHRLPSGAYGLTNWYPNIRPDKSKEGSNGETDNGDEESKGTSDETEEMEKAES